MKTIMITGGAGFIGFHLTRYILQNDPECSIISVDNLNTYYDPTLKMSRLKKLEDLGGDRFIFKKLDVANKKGVDDLFEEFNFSNIIHLAAQAGVRYARENPKVYIETNLQGFFNIIDNAARRNIQKLVYASSSSVYGTNQQMPFKETDRCSSPMSLYAATKISNEALAASYFYTHNLKTIGLRLFNVFGPWGRPDMAYYKWADALVSGGKVELRNKGEMYRDMTYIDDAVQVISKLAFDYSWDNTSHDIFNVGNRSPVKIVDVLEYLQEKLNVKYVNIVHTERGSEEPLKTYADTNKLEGSIGFVPDTNFREGIDNFIEWFKKYHKIP